MANSEELRSIIRRLPDIYNSGDIAAYLAHYAPDVTTYYAGSVMNTDEVRKFNTSLFEGGGKTLDFQIGSRDHLQFSESGDAAIVSYPWRERFHLTFSSAVTAPKCLVMPRASSNTRSLPSCINSGPSLNPRDYRV